MLSVIIPTRNRAERLELALRSLAQQALPRSSFEIIVVDNGSRDRTLAVVTDFKETFARIHYIYEDLPGLHVGRHRGFHAAKGDILVFLDDDVEAFPSLLASIEEAFGNPKVALVGGKCLPKHEGPVPEWLNAMWAPNSHGERVVEYLSLIDLGDLPKVVDPLRVFGCNFSIRRSVLLAAGGPPRWFSRAAHPFPVVMERLTSRAISPRRDIVPFIIQKHPFIITSRKSG